MSKSTQPALAHTLNLKKGDVLKLQGFEDGRNNRSIGDLFEYYLDDFPDSFKKGYLRSDNWTYTVPSRMPVGTRPLFLVHKRAPVVTNSWVPYYRHGFGSTYYNKEDAIKCILFSKFRDKIGVVHFRTVDGELEVVKTIRVNND